MIPSLTQESIDQYASNALTIQKPEGTDYSQGAHVNRTIPAKWWNWLFSAVTKRIQQSRADAANMLTELNNVITDADMQPSSATNNQLSQAVNIHAQRQIDEYIASEKTQAFLVWQTPDTIYIGGYVLTTDVVIIDLHCVNGLYIATVSGKISSSSITHSFTASSFDLVHWYNTHGDSNPAQIGCVYLSGKWYLVYSGQYRGRSVAVSSNGMDWETIRYLDLFPDAPPEHDRYAVGMQYGCIGILPWGTPRVVIVMYYELYSIYSAPDWTPVNEHGLAILYNNGTGSEEWTFVKVEVTDSDFLTTNYYQWCAQDVRKLNDTSLLSIYTMGGTIFNPIEGTVTFYADKIIPLTEAEKASIGTNRDAVNDVFNAKCITLRNSSKTYALTSTNIVVYDYNNHTVNSLAWVPDLKSYIFGDLDVLLLCSDCRNTTVKTSFSYDGVDKIDFPAQWDFGSGPEGGEVLSVCKLNNYYYLAVWSTNDNNIRGLYKTSLLSGNSADYTYLGAMPAYKVSDTDASESNFNRLVPAGYKNWLVAGSYFTRDEGRNWLQGAYVTSSGTKICGPANVIANNSIYGANTSYYTFTRFNLMTPTIVQYCSDLNVNYVNGHTLYLR